MNDNVNHPKHYNSHPSGVECIEITEYFNFNIGNAVKYCWRAGLKGEQVEDLRARGGPAGRDRSVPAGQTQAGHRQPAQVPARQPDARASLEGRQPNLGPEDLQEQTNRRNREGEGV